MNINPRERESSMFLASGNEVISKRVEQIIDQEQICLISVSARGQNETLL